MQDYGSGVRSEALEVTEAVLLRGSDVGRVNHAQWGFEWQTPGEGFATRPGVARFAVGSRSHVFAARDFIRVRREGRSRANCN
jgi:hypothetical protein